MIGTSVLAVYELSLQDVRPAPSNSFPTEILNSDERGCWVHFGLVLTLCQSVMTQEMWSYCTDVTTRGSPCVSGSIPREVKWGRCGLATPVSPLQNHSGVHGGAEGRCGLTGPEPVRGGRELR